MSTTQAPTPTIGDAAYRTLMASEASELEELTRGKVRCVIVTPERAVLDAVCEMVILPMYDGELGVLRGRAPFVGQLAPGELRLRTGEAVARFFVDGGFAQVRNNVVNVLTQKAMPAAEVTLEAAEQTFTLARAMAVTDVVSRDNRDRALARARGMRAVAAKGAAG
jgi:F-type H+-transporting ATPase subunit epsilon